MLPSFSLLLLCPFSLCQISITKSYFSLRLHITFYSQVENTATPTIPCSVFINVPQLLLFCHHHSIKSFLLLVFRELGLKLSHWGNGMG